MGAPKGAIAWRGEALIERVVRVAREAGLQPSIVGDASPYESFVLDVPRLVDTPTGVGPIGGLAALLAAAQGRRDERRADVARVEHVFTLAVDMPYVQPATLVRLVEHPSPAAVVAARREGRWEPFLARWDVDAARPTVAVAIARKRHALQPLFAALEADTFELDPHALDDWDTPDVLPADAALPPGAVADEPLES